jgi:hypothetical protein
MNALLNSRKQFSSHKTCPITSHTCLPMTSTYSPKPQPPMGSPPSSTALRKLPRLTLPPNRSSLHLSKENNIVGKSPSWNGKYTMDTYTISITSMFLPMTPYNYGSSKTTMTSPLLDTPGDQKPLTLLDDATSGLCCKRISNNS